MLGLVGALAVVFLASAVAVEVVVGLVAAGLGLGRLAAAPGKLGALEVVVGVVALLFTAFPEALLGRARSATMITAIVRGRGGEGGSDAIYTNVLSILKLYSGLLNKHSRKQRGFGLDGNSKIT